jgi:hypothetical protein
MADGPAQGHRRLDDKFDRHEINAVAEQAEPAHDNSLRNRRHSRAQRRAGWSRGS